MGKNTLLNGLSGIAQILFMNQPEIGVVFLLGIAIFSPFMALTCLVGTMIANYVAIVTKRSSNKVLEGLYGFNGALLGLALPVYLPHNLYLWIFLIVGAGLTVLLCEIISSRIGIPPLSLPYVLLTWLIIKTIGIQPTNNIGMDVSIWNISFLGIGQIFFLESILSGIVILVGLSFVSLRYVIFALFGASIGTLPILWLSNHSYVSAGLISLNTSLCMIAYLRLGLKVDKLFIVISTIFTAFIYPIFYTTLNYFSLPTLTFPFIVSMWIGILLFKGIKSWKILKSIKML